MANALPEIGWTFQGQRHTPEDPCTFVDRCTPFDANEWARHAKGWIDVAARYATTDDRKRVLAQIGSWLLRLQNEASSCHVFSCAVPVAGLIEVSRAARNYAIVWSDNPADVTTPNTDLWQLPSLDEIREKIETKMKQAAEALKEKASEAAKDAIGDDWGWAVIAAIALLVFAGMRK